MDKFIKPDRDVRLIAEALVYHLRNSIYCINELWIKHEDSKICTKAEPPFLYRGCIEALSTVIKKVNSTYLGHSDFELWSNSFENAADEWRTSHANR